MKIEPPKKSQKPRPFALIVPGWKTIFVQSSTRGEIEAHGPAKCYELLSSLCDHACYTPGGLRGFLHTTGAKCWSGRVWRGRITSLLLDGSRTSILSLRGLLDETPDPFSALDEGLSWLSDQGVRPASLSAMAWNLWTRTLPRPLELAFRPEIGRAALYGGRQACGTPKKYQHQIALDLSQAYPHTMASRPYAATLRRVSKATELDWTSAGIARASVRVPFDLPFAPLPVRVARDVVQYQTGRIEGFWPWCELVAARELGAEVTVEECYAPMHEADPFSTWYERVQEGRALFHGGERIAKAVTSSLWGMFGMLGEDRAIIGWADDFGDEPVTLGVMASKMPHASTAHIAAETSARVRRRLLLEVLSGPFPPIHVDTDGIIVRSSFPMPSTAGTGPGEWRIKTKMPIVEVRAPQVYRYRTGDSPEWHYVTAGTSRARAADLFEKTPRTRIAIGTETILPQGYAHDEALSSQRFGRVLA